MMVSERIVIKYPPRLIDKPVLCYLTKEHDLEFNILRAQVSPETGGLMVLEISGDKGKYGAALKKLESQGVSTQRLSRDVRWDMDRCTHCGLCVTLCPSEALAASVETREVSFQAENCVACEYCIRVCPVQAMHVEF